MADDHHLGTGEYTPERYWEERARRQGPDRWGSVCGFGRSERENQAMAAVQEAALRRALRGVDLAGRRVVEIGCGIGRWGEFFAEQGADYLGLDISESMLRRAKGVASRGSFVRFGAAGIPLKNGVADVVVAITVLHHNPYERQEALAMEMGRILRKGGWIYLMEGIARRQESTLFNMFPRTRSGWIRLFEENLDLRLHKEQTLRWWIARDAVRKLARVSKLASNSRWFDRMVESRLLELSIRWDARLVGLLPRRFATTVGLLFRKSF